MKRIHWIFALLLLLVVPSACTDQTEMPNAGSDSDVPEGMVRMRIAPVMLDQSVVVTRTNSTPIGQKEKTIVNCRVLVFDKDPISDPSAVLSQPPATPTNITENRLLDVLLFEEISAIRYICVVANLSPTNLNWLDGQDAGLAYTSIQRQLINTLPTTGNIRIEPNTLPMSGWMASGIEIKKEANPTLLSSSVTLSRSVARIDVDATATKALGEEFKITGAGVVNCPRTGTHLPDPAGKLTRWDVTRVGSCSIQKQAESATTFTSLTEQVYAYEHDGAAGSSAEHPLRIVVSGIRAGATTESFYGIDIVYTPNSAEPDKKSMEIRRNNIYTIKLNKVRKDGYATYEEAARSASFNTQLDADITVTDPFAHDIVTNGRQYLGVTNTEYVLYPYDDQVSQNLAIVSFTYTSDPAWMAGQITVPPYITLPPGTQQSLTVSPYPVQRDLVVNIGPQFTEGIVVLHIGNLKKEIKVRRMAPTSAAGGVYSNYYAGAPKDDTDKTTAFKEFKIGEVINFSATTSWLQVATTDDISGEAALSNRVVTGIGGVYVHVANNFSYGSTTAFAREASIYLAGDKQGERVKVHVQQPSADVYKNITKIEPFAYVGAFWRHNQTAERIIRMYGKQDKNGDPETVPDFWWQANVVAGQEWIVMDIAPPGTVKDEQVRHYQGGTPNPYGVGDDANTAFGSDIETSFSCQVNSKLRSVGGTGNYIYFRIGLTSKLTSASTPPRYGLIMISYGSTAGKIDGYHPIYIRQGEADDYLMRPFDPITRDPKLSLPNDQYPSRPNAARVSPFNLDAPDNVSVDPDDNSFTGYHTLSTRGGTFASYPSQTGSYFQGRRISATGLISAFPPSTRTVPPEVYNYTTAWDPIDEACPHGYRRIQDGAVTAQDAIGAIIGSEIRQSLMLFPAQGGDYQLINTQSALTNQYRGYLADGYFDRLEITVFQNDIGLAVPHSIVKSRKAGQAHIGALFFNPNNYASIFLPFTGRWGGAAGITNQYKDVGINTSLVTSTPAKADKSYAAWYLWVGTSFDSSGKDFTSMYPSSTPRIPSSLRCVRDDRPIVETGGKLPETNTDDGSGTNIDRINRDTDPDNQSDISARHLYQEPSRRTLQQEIEAEYTTLEKRKQIGSIVISGNKPLTMADYAYLNAWADGNNNINGEDYSGTALRHITIHGNSITNFTIPTGAFTSSRWITIELRTNIKVIEDGAFAATLTSGLKTLIVSHLDPVTVTAGASGAFLFTTSTVNLRLNGYEWEQITPSDRTWKNRTWASIRKDN